MSHLTTIGGITAYREPRLVCSHETRSAARVGDDTIASVFECDECGDQRPFTNDDFAFCNTQRWSALRFGRKIAGA